jgi:hypothetical protein
MEYTAGIWSVYAYDGYLYASDMYEGLEVLRLTDPLFADVARYDNAGLNPQTQPEYAWVWREAPVVPAAESERAPLETVSVEPAAIEPAASATVSVSQPPGSLAPGETTDIWWMPTQSVLATVAASADGSLPATSVTLPGPLEPGRYDLVVRGDVSAPRIALASVTVAAPEPSPDARPPDDGGLPWWPLVVIPITVLLAAAVAVVVLRHRRASR